MTNIYKSYCQRMREEYNYISELQRLLDSLKRNNDFPVKFRMTEQEVEQMEYMLTLRIRELKGEVVR